MTLTSRYIHTATEILPMLLKNIKVNKRESKRRHLNNVEINGDGLGCNMKVVLSNLLTYGQTCQYPSWFLNFSQKVLIFKAYDSINNWPKNICM